MSEQNKINVQPVVNIQSLQEQLNKQKYKINVDIDTSNLSNQLQSTVSQVTNNMQPAKIPLEINTDSISKGLTTFNQMYMTYNNAKNLSTNISKSLD